MTFGYTRGRSTRPPSTLHDQDALSLPIIGSFLLTVELLCLQLCLGAFCLQLDLFTYSCRGPPTTHHPHKRVSSSGGILGGGGVRIVGTQERATPTVCKKASPRERGNRALVIVL